MVRQYWTLCIDGQYNACFGPLDLALFHAALSQLDNYLRAPIFPEPFPVPAHTLQPDTSPFVAWPAELIRRIFEELSQSTADEKYSGPYDSMIHLSLTCSRMWMIGERECRRYLFNCGRASLAGRRLVILGNKCSDEALPSRILTKEERSKVYEEDAKLNRFDYEKRTGVRSHEWYWKTVEEPMKAKVWSGVGTIQDVILFDKMFRAHQLDTSYNATDPLLSPPSGNLVLRNLKTKEFVRESTIAVKGSAVICNITLGSAVAVRICFSEPEKDNNIHRLDDAIWPGPGEFDISQGPWAGHTFDITDVSEVAKEGWKDVSLEVAKEIDFVWTCQYGDDWKDMKKGYSTYTGFQPVEFV